jgi:uncharacterized membrane protein YdjX (TVP38/TMEM64 family)
MTGNAEPGVEKLSFRKNFLFKTILLGVLVVSLLTLQFFWDIESYFNPGRIKDWLATTGGLAPAVYMAIMTVAVVVSPIPSLPLNIAAGGFFGPFLGTLYSVAGALVGAVVSFFIARLLGRELIERFISGHINFCTVCSDRLLTKVIFVARLIPFISFDIVSYGAGLTKISLGRFSLATLFGMVPVTFAYNYFGSVWVLAPIKGMTIAGGLVMVILFFLMPYWIEKRNLFSLREILPHLKESPEPASEKAEK